ncbi:hypothetical protein AMTRI_Chr07g31060 [Amborella trichopoda]
MGRPVVLVVGGSGYLGQHLLQEMIEMQGNNAFNVGFTYNSNPQCFDSMKPMFQSFRVDLQTGQGLDSISTTLGEPDVVINCAAISVPRACETNPTAALAINVPSRLVKWLSSFDKASPLLIHLSTDQVYEGVKSFYKEEDETVPVNMYGKLKVKAEQFISSNCSNFAILRSSIIYGPETMSPIPKSLPIQWIDSVLSQGREVEFFHDEYRCPVYIKDVVRTILALTNMWLTDEREMQLVLNVGGPDRLSRLEMAEVVAKIRCYDSSKIKSISASLMNRGVISPADISMDISKLNRVLGISPTPFEDGVTLTLGAN